LTATRIALSSATHHAFYRSSSVSGNLTRAARESLAHVVCRVCEMAMEERTPEKVKGERMAERVRSTRPRAPSFIADGIYGKLGREHASLAFSCAR
jgi:hypothetical protein